MNKIIQLKTSATLFAEAYTSKKINLNNYHSAKIICVIGESNDATVNFKLCYKDTSENLQEIKSQEYQITTNSIIEFAINDRELAKLEIDHFMLLTDAQTDNTTIGSFVCLLENPRYSK